MGKPHATVLSDAEWGALSPTFRLRIDGGDRGFTLLVRSSTWCSPSSEAAVPGGSRTASSRCRRPPILGLRVGDVPREQVDPDSAECYFGFRVRVLAKSG